MREESSGQLLSGYDKITREPRAEIRIQIEALKKIAYVFNWDLTLHLEYLFLAWNIKKNTFG